MVVFGSQQIFEWLKRLTSNGFDTMQNMHEVGFDMRILGRPTKEQREQFQ